MPKRKVVQRTARKGRIRRRVSGTPDRPRMTVFRSGVNIYVQVIDDVEGKTITQASSVDKDLKSAISEIKPPEPVAEEAKAEEAPKGQKGKKGGQKGGKKKAPKAPVTRNLLVAEAVGVEIANRCKAKNIEKVVFDRNGYKYHGRVKTLAEAARKAGLAF